VFGRKDACMQPTGGAATPERFLDSA